MILCYKEKNNYLVHIIKKGLQCQGMSCPLLLVLTFLENICWQNILELLQGYDSNSLNTKELVHQIWLNMVKLNTPTHELEKIGHWSQVKNKHVQEKIKMRRTYLFKLVMAMNNSITHV